MKPGSILYERPEEFRTAFNYLMDRIKGSIVTDPSVLDSPDFANLRDGERLLKEYLRTTGPGVTTVKTGEMPVEAWNFTSATFQMTPYEFLEYEAAKYVASKQSDPDYRDVERIYRTKDIRPCRNELERAADLFARSLRKYVDVMMVEDNIISKKHLMMDTLGTAEDAYMTFVDNIVESMGVETKPKLTDPKTDSYEFFLVRPGLYDPEIFDGI